MPGQHGGSLNLLTSWAYAAILVVLIMRPVSAQAPAAPVNPPTGQPPVGATIPSADEVARLLRDEPVSRATWPVWRGRLTAWFGDESTQTDAAYDAVRTFLLKVANPDKQLTGELARDELAWYFYGFALLREAAESKNAVAENAAAERALKRSIELAPRFARPHRALAQLYISRNGTDPAKDLEQAEREIKLAKELDPQLRLHGLDGQLSLRQNRPDVAYRAFDAELRRSPNDSRLAFGKAYALLSQKPNASTARVREIQELVARFPADGDLMSALGIAQAMDDDPRGALKSFARARALGAEPARFVPARTIRAIEEAAQSAWYEWLGWVLVYVAAFYAVWMALMALAGVILASFTRGQNALGLLQADPAQMLSHGSIVRARQETLLARLYALTLFAGLVLFYVSIPFVLAGLLGGTCVVIYGIFALGRIPVKLVVLVALFGFGLAWAVLKSIFAKPETGAFGLLKSAEQTPRLHELVRDVARRIDTDPVDEVYLAPGVELSVHQEGKGPFGMFGVKKRVLTVGMANMRYLTVGELRAILAHEYGHFSHQDTFYNRFIYQVTLSLNHALGAMGATLGKLNYINPFFWFLYLYSRSFSLLSAGYSRSREFLADRMACCLYGADVFTSGLKKVASEGTVFNEHSHVVFNRLLEPEAAIVNLYESFHRVRQSELTDSNLKDCFEKALLEKKSLFASHPTVVERLAAVADLPSSRETDDRLALQLFDAPDEIERELTEFLADHFRATIAWYQAVAEAAAAQG